MGKPNKVKNNPLLHYYPVRYAQSRASFLDETLKVFTQIFPMDNVVEFDSLLPEEAQQISKLPQPNTRTVASCPGMVPAI